METQWPLVLFTVLAGGGAWLFVFIALAEFTGKGRKSAFVGSLIALISLALGGFASLAHLSHPTRMFAALEHPTSGIFMEIVFVFLTAVCIFVFLILSRKAEGSSLGLKISGGLGLVFGIILSFMVGNSYVMEARPAWDTILLPIAYVGTATVVGAGVYLLLSALLKEDGDTRAYARLVTIVSAVIAGITAVIYAAASGGLEGNALLFLGATVICGAIIPIIAALLGRKENSSALLLGVLSAGGALVGATTFRVMMWMMGSGVEDFFNVIM